MGAGATHEGGSRCRERVTSGGGDGWPVLAGVLVAIKSAVFLLRRIFRIASSEVQARGKDEAFLLNLAARRRSG